MAEAVPARLGDEGEAVGKVEFAGHLCGTTCIQITITSESQARGTMIELGGETGEQTGVESTGKLKTRRTGRLEGRLEKGKMQCQRLPDRFVQVI